MLTHESIHSDCRRTLTFHIVLIAAMNFFLIEQLIFVYKLQTLLRIKTHSFVYMCLSAAVKTPAVKITRKLTFRKTREN